MRVTGGRLRGRSISAPTTAARPTRDAVREAIFNLLHHGRLAVPPPPEGMRVLDLFAGSGTLGIEALSRGAACCLFVDIDAKARAALRNNIDSLGLAGASRICRRDARRLGKLSSDPYDLAFVDPPYGAGLTVTALEGIRPWMREGALAVVESDVDEPLKAAGWNELDHRAYGRTAVRIFRLDDSV